MAAERVPAFQFYPKDFLTDERVQLMSHTERGVYITLLCMCWLEKTLPLETKQLAMLVNMPLARFTKLWEHSPIKQCFQVNEDGRLHHKRLDVERDKQDTYRRRQADAAAVRWEKRVDATALPAQCPRVADEEEKRLVVTEGVQGKPPRSSLVEDDIGKRAAQLVERYGVLFSQHQRGARYRPRPNLDWVEACDLCRIWSNERLEQLAVIVLTTNDPWISKTDRAFKIFAMKASWADARLAKLEGEGA